MNHNGRPWRNGTTITENEGREILQRMEAFAMNASLASREWYRQLFDPRRDIDAECGYPSGGGGVNVELYRQLFDREAIANRVVQVLPKECWQVNPLIYEDAESEVITEFEEAWDNLQSGMSNTWHQDEEGSTIWDYLLRLDILSGIGHFGVMLLGIDDGKDLQEPIEGMIEYGARPPEPRVRKGKKEKDVKGENVKDKPTKGKVIPPRTIPVPSRNQRRRIIANAQKRTIAQDGPPTAEEKAYLDSLLTNKQITLNKVSWSKEGYKVEQENRPANFLNHYDPSVARAKREAVANARREQGHSTRGDESFSPKDISLTENYDPTANDFSRRSTGGSTSDGRTVADMSGTDAQYFSVQFGPSEQQTTEAGKKPRRLLFLRVFDESLVQVVRWEWNVNNPRFGQPILYRITLNDPKDQMSGVGLPLATVFVHWTRIIHVSENRRSSEVSGVPRMEPVLNRLLDLRKLYAGSAEGYWKGGCSPLISFETHPQLGGDAEIDVPGVRDMMEQVYNGLQRVITAQGASAKVVAPPVADPTPQINVQIEAICVQLGIPVPVFKGYEIGEQASTENRSQWDDRIRHRQKMHCTSYIIIPFVDRLIAIGVLPEPEGYTCEWPELDSLTATEKAAIALQISQALAQFTQGNIEALMTFFDFAVNILGWDEEKAQAVVDAAMKAHEDEETMSIPPMVGGRPVAPPPGTQEHADQQQQQARFDMMQQQKQEQFKTVQAAKTGAPPAKSKPKSSFTGKKF